MADIETVTKGAKKAAKRVTDGDGPLSNPAGLAVAGAVARGDSVRGAEADRCRVNARRQGRRSHRGCQGEGEVRAQGCGQGRDAGLAR